jgi:hypothetical protein
MSALTAHGKTPLVTETTVTIDVDEPLDVHGDLLAEVPFHLTAALDHVANGSDLKVRQLLRPHVGGNICLLKDLESRRAANSEDISERDVDPLVAGKIDAFDTSHGLALPLLVLWILAQHADHTAAAHHTTFVADLLYGSLHFHLNSSPALPVQRMKLLSLNLVSNHPIRHSVT